MIETTLAVQPKTATSPSIAAVGSLLQRQCDCGNHTMGSECDECSKKKGMLQRNPSGGFESTEVPPIVHEVLRSPGRPLDDNTRSLLEPKLGRALNHVPVTAMATPAPQRMSISQPGDFHERQADRIADAVLSSHHGSGLEREQAPEWRYDLSRIRIHTDQQAAESAQAVNALAYTVGNHVVFGSSSYSPHSAAGLHLLTHELAHTAQQSPVLARKAGAFCLGPEVCKDVTTPSSILTEAKKESQTRRTQREKLCNKPVPDPGCRADRHADRAVHLEKLLRGYDPSFMATTEGIFIDRDLEKAFRAVTVFCNTFTPPLANTGHCLTVPIETEKEAEEFNTTSGPREIDGKERGLWRERTLELLIHEAQHTRFRTKISPISKLVPGGVPVLVGKPRKSCSKNEQEQQDVHSAMNELSSMVQEFRLRREFLKTTVGFSPAEKQGDMEAWRDDRVRPDGQSIKSSLRTARCFCGCGDANDLIRETIKFATSSWTVEEMLALDLEMTHHRYSDLNLDWPSGSSSQKIVPDRLLPAGEEMA